MSNSQPEENGNLLNFIAATVEMIRDRMATKDDVIRLDARIDRLEGKVDGLEGKVDSLEDRMGRLEVKIDKVEVDTTAIRGDLEQVHLRLDGIDKSVSLRVDHVEAEMSRMRSVLYLLVKDRPDMLRLLGQSPPASG